LAINTYNNYRQNHSKHKRIKYKKYFFIKIKIRDCLFALQQKLAWSLICVAHTPPLYFFCPLYDFELKYSVVWDMLSVIDPIPCYIKINNPYISLLNNSKLAIRGLVWPDLKSINPPSEALISFIIKKYF